MSVALQKVVALGILVALLCAPALAAVLAYRSYQSGELEFLERLETYDRLRSVAAFAPALENQRNPDDAALFAKWFLDDGAPSLITAELQSRLKSMAAAHGVDVLQASEAAKVERAGAAYLGDRIDVSGTASAVGRLLADIEASVPFLFVERIEIRSEAVPQGDQSVEPPLFAAIEVYGAVRSVAKPTGTAP